MLCGEVIDLTRKFGIAAFDVPVMTYGCSGANPFRTSAEKALASPEILAARLLFFLPRKTRSNRNQDIRPSREEQVLSARDVMPRLLADLKNLALRHVLWITAGPFAGEDAREETPLDRVFILDDAGTVHVVHEQNHFLHPGDETKEKEKRKRAPCFFEVDGVTFSLVIGDDLLYPEYVRALSLRAHVLLVTLTSSRVDDEDADILLRARALESQIFVVAVESRAEGCAETTPCVARAFGPGGYVLENEGNVYSALFNIDSLEVARMRKKVPLLSGRRNELYAPLISL